MFRSIGFIGTGHMGSALARVAAKERQAAPVYLANRTQEKARRLAQELDCRVADNETIAQHCDLIFLGVKPQLMDRYWVLCPRSWAARKGQVCSGVYGRWFVFSDDSGDGGGGISCVRLMPNHSCGGGCWCNSVLRSGGYCGGIESTSDTACPSRSSGPH